MSLSEMIAETSIDGCTVEMWDHEGTITCHIEKSRCRSSLGVAEDLGILEGDDGAVHEIDTRTCERVRQWAERHGY